LSCSSKNPQNNVSTIRWSGIQQILEEAWSDTLIIMDAAYYPSSKLVRRHGVLELVAASASEDHFNFLDRSAFTRTLIQLLHIRASQNFTTPLSAAELHAKLLSFYPKMILDRHPEKDILTSFPSPLHIQLTGTSFLPSILLAPSPKGIPPPFGLDTLQSGSQLNLTFRLTDDSIDMESWSEWLRMMPEGIKDVKVEGPFRNTLR
jgi:hypothetical protein